MEIKVKDQVHILTNWQECGSGYKSWRRATVIGPQIDISDQIALWYIAQEDCCYYVSFEGNFRFMQEIYDSCFMQNRGKNIFTNKYIYTDDADQLKARVDNFINRFNSLKAFL